MAGDTTTQTTRLVLEAGDISKGLDKLEKDVFKIGVKTEETLAKLNSQSSLYKTLESNHSRLVEFQAKINKLKTDDTKSSSQINKELQYSLNKFSVMKQQVTDINKVLGTTPSQLKRQENELTRVQDKFASLNREVRQLEGHYKGFGSNKNLDALKGKLEDIKKQQQIINTLSSKGIVNLTTKDLRTLDTAKAKFRSLKNEVAEIKTDLSDVPISGLARSAGLRALGYSGLFSAIALTTQSIREGVGYVLEYEQSVTRLSVILDVNTTKAEELQQQIVGLTKAYGDSLKEINEVALSLGRAGVRFEQVASATEAVVKLAKLTGDSVETATGAVVSFIQVFGKDQFGQAIKTTEELGAMIAFIANESKLSIQDINTLGNYALQTAKALNITENALGAISIALSNSGVNSSSLGTSVRRLQKIFTASTPALEKFFDSIGLNRQQLLLEFAKGGEASNQAFERFIKTLSTVDASEFIRLTGSFDVLIKETLNQLKNNANPILDAFNDSFNVTNEELNKANKLAETNIAVFKRLGNTLLDVSNNAGFLLDNLADVSRGLIFVIDNINKLSPKGLALNLGKADEVLKVSVSRLREYESQLLKLSKEDYTLNASVDLISINKEIEKEIKRVKNVLPYLNEEIKEDFEQQVTQLETLAKDSFSKLNLQDIFSNSTQTLKLKSQIFDLELKAEFEGLDTTEKDLLTKLRKIRDNLSKSGVSKIDIKDILSSEDVDTLKQQGKLLSAFYSDTSDSIQETITSNFDFLNKKLQKSISEVNALKSNLSTEFSTDLNVGNLSQEFVKVSQEVFRVQESLKNLSDEDLDSQKEQLTFLEKRKSLIQNLVELQTFIITQQKELKEVEKTRSKEVQKRYKQEDDITKTLVKQIIETNLLTKAGEERSSQIAEEIATRKENLILIKSSTEYEKEIAKIKSLEVDYAKTLNKEETKRENILERVKNKVKDEELRIQELLGLKDKELQSENALRDLRASKDFQKLPQEQQDAQVKALENLIKQEKAYKGLNKSVIEYSKSIPDVNEALEKVGSVGLQSLENGFMDFFDVTSEGFMDMEKLGKDVLKSIYQELIKTMLVQPLVGSIGSVLGGTQQSSSGNTTGSIVGGIISGIFGGFNQGGYLPTKGFANGGLLTGGSGVRDDLYMGNVNGTQVFAMGGEFFTKKDSVNAETRPMLEYINKTGSVPNMGATGQPVVVNTPTTINIENNTGQPIEASMVEEMMRNDEGEEYEKVVNIMLRAKNEDSRIRSAFSNGNQ